jgi:hypothetical protein
MCSSRWIRTLIRLARAQVVEDLVALHTRYKIANVLQERCREDTQHDNFQRLTVDWLDDIANRVANLVEIGRVKQTWMECNRTGVSEPTAGRT